LTVVLLVVLKRVRVVAPGRVQRSSYACSVGVDWCARCGRPINVTGGAWTPTAPGELCEWCLTGHDPDWIGRYGPHPPQRLSRRLILLLLAFTMASGVLLFWFFSSQDDSGGMPAWGIVAMAAATTAIVGLIIWDTNREIARGDVPTDPPRPPGA
jgi:hypothetical protein